jgi:alkylated DNA repair dioxygenase AlkB
VRGQQQLFERPSELPDGLVCRPEFLTPSGEQSILEHILAVPLSEARYKSFTAKRRIVSFGFGSDFGTNALTPAPPFAPFLLPLRERVSEWTGIPVAELVQSTIAEYTPGTQLGWHRDVPRFGSVVGISLGSPARMVLPRPGRHLTCVLQGGHPPVAQSGVLAGLRVRLSYGLARTKEWPTSVRRDPRSLPHSRFMRCGSGRSPDGRLS